MPFKTHNLGCKSCKTSGIVFHQTLKPNLNLHQKGNMFAQEQNSVMGKMSFAFISTAAPISAALGEVLIFKKGIKSKTY
jgi:hypothetical protein